MIDLILPSGKMEKSLRMVLGIFLIASLLSPFSDGIPKFKIKFEKLEDKTTQTDKFMAQLDKQFESLAEDNLKNIIKDILKDLGIKNEKIEIFMDTNKDNCISINKCRIHIPKGTKKLQNGSAITSSEILEVEKEIEKKLSIKTEVILMD